MITRRVLMLLRLQVMINEGRLTVNVSISTHTFNLSRRVFSVLRIIAKSRSTQVTTYTSIRPNRFQVAMDLNINLIRRYRRVRTMLSYFRRRTRRHIRVDVEITSNNRDATRRTSGLTILFSRVNYILMMYYRALRARRNRFLRQTSV